MIPNSKVDKSKEEQNKFIWQSIMKSLILTFKNDKNVIL